jgi:hypothetical protein
MCVWACRGLSKMVVGDATAKLFDFVVEDVLYVVTLKRPSRDLI